jgi:hypothetical protein
MQKQLGTITPLPLCAPVGRGYKKSAYAGKGIY